MKRQATVGTSKAADRGGVSLQDPHNLYSLRYPRSQINVYSIRDTSW
jgi:hypothetical protein